MRVPPFCLVSIAWLGFGGSPVASQTAPAPATPAAGPKISGYLQGRETYQKDLGLTGSINRARITVAGALAGFFTWRIQGEFRTGNAGTGKASVALQDAYIRYARAGAGVQVGQFKTPFTREFLASLAELETADRSTVVDSLAPKRDIGVMGDWTMGGRVTLAAGIFNGDGQNTTGNRDSTALGVARVALALRRDLSLGVNAARYFGDSLRYGVDAAYEGPRVTLKAEYVGQSRDGIGAADDRGWYGLGGVKFARQLQLVGKYEAFRRPAVVGAPDTRAWTAGANLFLAGPAVRLTVNYVSRKMVSSRTGQLITQLQARF